MCIRDRNIIRWLLLINDALLHCYVTLCNFFNQLRIRGPQNHDIWDPIASPTPLQWNSSIVQATILKATWIWCAWHFWIYFFFISNKRRKHWNTYCTKWIKQLTIVFCLFFSQSNSKVSDYRAVGLLSRTTIDMHQIIYIRGNSSQSWIWSFGFIFSKIYNASIIWNKNRTITTCKSLYFIW